MTGVFCAGPGAAYRAGVHLVVRWRHIGVLAESMMRRKLACDLFKSRQNARNTE